jgi:hypothetical protein
MLLLKKAPRLISPNKTQADSWANAGAAIIHLHDMQEWYTLSLHHCHVVMMQHTLLGVFHLQFPTLTYLMGNQQIGIYTYPSCPLDELVCPLRAHKPWALSTSISNCGPCVTLLALPIRVVVNWASSLQRGNPHKQFLNLTLYCSTIWSIMILKILPHASTHSSLLRN